MQTVLYISAMVIGIILTFASIAALVTNRRNEGYTELFSSGDGVSKNIDLGMLYLNKTEGYQDKSGSKEIVLIILGGKCSVKVGDNKFNSLGKRKNVFEKR